MLKLVVLSCVMAAASAVHLFGFGAPLAYTAPFLAPNYRGPISLAPGEPADIIAADGRPFDTLDVNLDKTAHYTAKVVDAFHGAHVLKKRAAPFIAPLAPLTYGAHFAYGAPWAYTAPFSALTAARLSPYTLPFIKK